MYLTIVTTAIFSLPSALAKFAHRDMWMPPIWSLFGGLFVLSISYGLHKLYPKETIVEYSVHILGRIPGKIVGLVFILFYLHINCVIIRGFGEFMVSSFFPRTPILITIGSVVLVSAFAVRGGVEVLGRCAGVFAPLVLILFLMLVLLLIPELHPKYLFPIMEDGLKPSLIAALFPASSWYSEILLGSFLLPYLTDNDKGMRWGVISLLAVSFTMVLTNIVSLFLYGDMTESISISVLVASRYIEIADFIEHLEALVMAIWILGVFVKISMFFYAIVLGASQWFGLSDYRLLMFPFGLISAPLSLWLAINSQELSRSFYTTEPFYHISVQYLIPLLLITVAFIRKKMRRKVKEAST